MITGYFGLPGSGKTTFLTMLAQQELRKISRNKSKYTQVLTNFYCSGCRQINWSDFEIYTIENSLILIDEITLFADSRDFAKFPQRTKEFFLLHRHYHNDIIYFTQHYNNVDKKIRDVTYDLYFVKPSLPFTSVARRIFRTLDINDQTHEIVNGYRFSTILDVLFGGCLKFCFRPRWYRYFDSFEADRIRPRLPERSWDVSSCSLPPTSAKGLKRLLQACRRFFSASKRPRRKGRKNRSG